MAETKIEWTDFSINPIRARLDDGDGHYCEKISPGCKHCYSSKLQPRFRMPQFAEQRGKAEPYLDAGKLAQVLKRRSPTKFFWCDMTDMFGAWVPNEWIAACFGVMAATPQHTHQVLTKRIDRAIEFFHWMHSHHAGRQRHMAHEHARRVLGSVMNEDKLAKVAREWPLANVWLGVSAEDQQRWDERVPLLKRCPAAVRFVSVEPLLGPIKTAAHLPLVVTCGDCLRLGDVPCADHLYQGGHVPGIDWVIVGGESGNGARECHVQWIRAIVEQCKDAGVAVFVKQLGATIRVPDAEPIGDVESGWSAYARPCISDDFLIRLPHRKGGNVDEWPHDLRVRQFPEPPKVST